MIIAKAERLISILLLTWLASAGSLAHATYEIPQSVIAGGGTSVSGAYSVTGTIGQGITGASTGGTYTVNGGFWAGGASTGGGTIDVALYVTILGSGSGSVTSSPAGITCPGTCVASFTGVTSVTLNATPTDANSVFTGWLGPCTGRAACVIGTAGIQNM